MGIVTMAAVKARSLIITALCEHIDVSLGFKCRGWMKMSLIGDALRRYTRD